MYQFQFENDLLDLQHYMYYMYVWTLRQFDVQLSAEL